MLSTAKDMKDFNSTVRLISTESPKVKYWLEWWVQADRSRLLFDVVKASLGETHNVNLQSLSFMLFYSYSYCRHI